MSPSTEYSLCLDTQRLVIVEDYVKWLLGAQKKKNHRVLFVPIVRLRYEPGKEGRKERLTPGQVALECPHEPNRLTF